MRVTRGGSDMSRREKIFSINVVMAVFLILWGFVLMCAEASHAAEKLAKPPVTRYSPPACFL